MRRSLTLLTAAVALAGCVDNTAPGNDREAALESPPAPAEVVPVGAALAGVSTGILFPQIITDADLQNVPDEEARCRFRFTRVGFPAFVYGPARGVIKLNGKLVPLPAGAEGSYGEGAVRVTLRPLSDDEERGQVLTELVVRLEGKPHELGFHGYSEC